jgi:chromosome segregation protein
MFRLERLEVVHWDFWQRLILPLDAAIVTIVGPNGSGKTTLLDALRTLLALDCSKKRDYKRYVRRNGEDFCWLRGVVDNRRQPSGKRPFPWAFHSEIVTLACRIEKKGGEWTRHYLIAEGDTAIEALQGNATQLGVREYQQMLYGAGLTPAIGQVLSLEQGQTDKLCELSPKALLDLVFQVFGDREVLDRYQEARQHQEATRRELGELEAQLDRLQVRIQKTQLDVDNFRTWSRLNEERTRLFGETRPRLEYHLLGDSILKGRSQIVGMQREWRGLVAEKSALQVRRPQAESDLAAAATRRTAALAEEQRAIDAQEPINRQAGKVEGLLGERDRLLRLASEAGGNPEAVVRQQGEAETRRDALRLELAGWQDRQRELAAIVAALASGQRAEPGEIRAFRAALDNAAIAHDLLVDLVEITDTHWQKAVEALLVPFAHLVILHRERDAEAAFALGEQHKYRHFIVPERSAPTLHAPGSIAEVVHFRRPVPGWIDKLLDRTQRVENARAGARLPRAQDWVTQSGYLRERRGGRHAAPEFARFGAARLAAVQARLAELAPRIAGHEASIGECEQTIAHCRAQLAGESATQTLAARAAEFSDAEARQAELEQRRQQVREALTQTRRQRETADETLHDARRAVENIAAQLREVDNRLAEKANKPARLEQARRLQALRRGRRSLPANWLDEPANAEIAREWESLAAIDREIGRIERDLAEKTWITDAGILVTRDKLQADATRQGEELAERERDNRMAEAQTTAAREQYVHVLRATVRRYARNLRTLGEMASIKVEAELPLLADDDLALTQAALSVKFDFDEKGFMGLNDGDASGGQQVMKSLILLIALMMEESHPGGFVFIDEPFAHLDIVNIDRVAGFLKATQAQYLLTTPVTHNVNVHDPSLLTLVTFKKKPGEPWAPRVGVLVRDTQ